MFALLLRVILLAAIVLAFVLRAGAEDPRITSLTTVDFKRIAAMKSADRETLARVFSEELRYAHSSGAVDTKRSFIDALTSGRTRYLSLEYEDRSFSFPSPHIALMRGRARLNVAGPNGEAEMLLSFLSVWREEGGQWRFLAWQSARIPPDSPVPR